MKTESGAKRMVALSQRNERLVQELKNISVPMNLQAGPCRRGFGLLK